MNKLNFSGVLLLMMLIGAAHAESFPRRIKNFNSYLFPQVGLGEKSDWFEWWYTKLVDPITHRGFYFTYGVVNPGTTTGPGAKYARAGVSFGDFYHLSQVEKSVPVQAFRASTEKYQVQIAAVENYKGQVVPIQAYADDRTMTGRISHEGREVKWSLSFDDSWGFNVMGWALYVQQLFDIYWYPIQGSMKASGTIEIGNETITLKDAPAYQDRNWGTGFPEWWTWIVANDFEGEKPGDGTVLVAGGGSPSVLGRRSPYEGVSMGLRYQGKTYAFRPTDGVFPGTQIEFGKWEVSATSQSGDKISFSASAPRSSFMDLQFLSPNGQIFHDYETLGGDLVLRFKPRGQKEVTLQSRNAGIEYGSFREH